MVFIAGSEWLLLRALTDLRTVKITVRLTEAEHNHIMQDAERRSMGIARLLRTAYFTEGDGIQTMQNKSQINTAIVKLGQILLRLDNTPPDELRLYLQGILNLFLDASNEEPRVRTKHLKAHTIKDIDFLLEAQDSNTRQYMDFLKGGKDDAHF